MKKHMKKLLAVVAALTMVFALAVPAMAATITIDNATYEKTYTAYKIFDASYSSDGSAVSYKVSSANVSKVSTDVFTVSANADSSGYYTVSQKDGVSDEAVIEWLGEHYSDFDSTGTAGTYDATKGSVTISGLDAGYYYVTSTLGSAIAVTSLNDSVTIKDKNASSPATPSKNIVSVDGTDVTAGKTADVHVGSTVGFLISGNATNYTTTVNNGVASSTKNTSYVITDTYANLTVPTEASAYTVTVNGETITTGYSVDTDTTGTVTITVNLTDADGNFLYKAESENSAYIPITVSYTATVAAGAADAAATNKAGDDTNTLTTYKFQLSKVDGNNQPLAGAKFTLSNGTTVLNFVANADGSYTYAPTATDDTVTELDLTTNTTVVVKGLDKSLTYTLHESVVPAGYNQAADVTINGSDLSPATAETAYAVTVKNEQGSTLPSTGGMGTTIFYVVGAALVIGAGVVIITRRRIAR